MQYILIFSKAYYWTKLLDEIIIGCCDSLRGRKEAALNLSFFFFSFRSPSQPEDDDEEIYDIPEDMREGHGGVPPPPPPPDDPPADEEEWDEENYYVDSCE